MRRLWSNLSTRIATNLWFSILFFFLLFLISNYVLDILLFGEMPSLKILTSAVFCGIWVGAGVHYERKWHERRKIGKRQ